jgi:predicted XRE-type DNA-binding protein
MNPYDIDYRKLKISKEITDERDLLKLKLIASFNKITSKMTTEEILELTGLHKSDLSRLRTFGMDRFTIDRLITLLDSLGYATKIDVKPKKAS